MVWAKGFNLEKFILVQCQMDTDHKKQVTIETSQLSTNIACVVHALVPISDDVDQKCLPHVGSICLQA